MSMRLLLLLLNVLITCTTVLFVNQVPLTLAFRGNVLSTVTRNGLRFASRLSSSSSEESMHILYADADDNDNDDNKGAPQINGAVNGNINSQAYAGPLPGVQLTAYQILHPYLFSPHQTGSDISRPLEKALRIMKRALEQIAFADMDFVLKTNPGAQVLRIEHTLSHTVDPLCWLHAQTLSSQREPIVYFSNAEQTFEAAAFGAAHLHKGAANEDMWNFFRLLPEDSHMYGGERFDRESEPDPEWNAFGSGLWMLPNIEIRRTCSGNCIGNGGSTQNSTTTLAVHVIRNLDQTWDIQGPLSALTWVTHQTSESAPPTNLPPVISRVGTYGPDLDSQDTYERGVTAALEQFASSSSTLEKVVLARRSNLVFDKWAHKLTALDILRKWKFGSNEGGHLLYLRPPGGSAEFFGCTPEQLFCVTGRKLITEALAGTRPRGSTQDADFALSRDLFNSRKDRAENEITGRFIRSQLEMAANLGLTQINKSILEKDEEERYFVRRLLHLQHICQRFECDLERGVTAKNIARFLLHALHPTPAVCGYPVDQAFDFIRRKESIAFDRGFYAGPFGYIGTNNAEIVVAIRSGLLSRNSETGAPIVSVFAGAGIVPGSTVQGEWAETSYKLNVVSTLFPPSPITLLSSPTPNVAWASAFIEELIRSGIRQFYVCPGSRSTPLVAALAKALRSNVGVVQAHSVHDERGAAFRALGYGRGRGRPAAVITSSGTAVANLYPAIMEAGMDGIPMVLLTADRPYENRETGANQAVDQVKAFSSTYVRWFRDIPPPNDDVPVSIALSDANHAVKMAIQQRGPVHLNIQFRENLAPDAGSIRNDDRVDSVTKFNGFRFTDVPNFYRWSRGGDEWINSVRDFNIGMGAKSVREIAYLIRNSNRGLIVVGCLREEPGQEADVQVEAIAEFAQTIGFPIFAGVQSGSLRSRSSAVVRYAEHLLKNPLISENIRPDLILQIGHPLVSSEIPSMISDAIKASESLDDARIVHHVLIHPHHPDERSDPALTLTHRISTDMAPFLRAVGDELEKICDVMSTCGSELSSLVPLGRVLGRRMPSIIEDASTSIIAEMRENQQSSTTLTEPQVVLAMSETMMTCGRNLPLFLSNSMAVRDSEFFLYPSDGNALGSVGVNRGASGIDGIISSATGYSEAKDERVALLIGDLAALHDLNSFHALSKSQSQSTKRSPPVTTVIVNNDGGGIFSFLPIASHASDVNFEEFFGTPTNTFSFEQGAGAFGLPFKSATNYAGFRESFESSLLSSDSTVVEAKVVSRDVNVAVHREITKQANDFLSKALGKALKRDQTPPRFPIKVFSASEVTPTEKEKKRKTLLLIHGWMGEKTDWNEIGIQLGQSLSSDWSIVAIDLDFRGDERLSNAEMHSLVNTLGLDRDNTENSGHEGQDPENSIDSIAIAAMRSLVVDHGIEDIGAVAGYSLGGRVAMAMSRICQSGGVDPGIKIMNDDTRLILLGAYPGSTRNMTSDSLRANSVEKMKRLATDRAIAMKLRNMNNRALLCDTASAKNAIWTIFLNEWYNAPIWGDLKARNPVLYRIMLKRRAEALSTRADQLALSLEKCSPGANSDMDWKFVDPATTLFLVGERDMKYMAIGTEWKSVDPDLRLVSVPHSGHALLAEAPTFVAEQIAMFLMGTENVVSEIAPKDVTKQRRRGAPSMNVDRQDNFSERNVLLGKPKSPTLEFLGRHRPVMLDFEAFAIDMINPGGKEKGVVGIGWGGKAHLDESNRIPQRRGFVLQLVSNDGAIVGVGEVSPLQGLHPESLEEARTQISLVQKKLESTGGLPIIDPASILSLNGGLATYLKSFLVALRIEELSPSVRSGLEMALISFASQASRKPVHSCLAFYVAGQGQPLAVLPLNGLVTRGVAAPSYQCQGRKPENHVLYSSLKVKVGHQDAAADVASLSMALQETKRLRPDANRAWTEVDALEFAKALDDLDVDIASKIEFVEEPIQKVAGNWSLGRQLDALERWHVRSGLQFGLDESLADVVDLHHGDYDSIKADLIESFRGITGCAAFVLKPALLGLELSMRLAKLAHQEFGVGVVFSCAFDSGVGLAYTAFLAAASDLTSGLAQKDLFAHGIGTFSLLDGDTLSPPFASYVSDKGILQVASLSRAFFGLGLDEMRSSFPSQLPGEDFTPASNDYRASAATSSSGREISVVVSLPLPFSDEIACSRFTDLPQQSRWSPWLSSVAYLDDGRETEWTLNVRGVKFSWRAVSSILVKPHRGILWESVSGLKNLGIAEFVPTSADSCTMKVRMTIVAPRVVTTLFPGASVFLEEFLQNKLLKWSLEMFRDVVKGDLALERGDVELGDALFGAVEGRANAIEASLSSQPTMTGEDVNGNM